MHGICALLLFQVVSAENNVASATLRGTSVRIIPGVDAPGVFEPPAPRNSGWSREHLPQNSNVAGLPTYFQLWLIFSMGFVLVGTAAFCICIFGGDEIMRNYQKWRDADLHRPQERPLPPSTWPLLLQQSEEHPSILQGGRL